MPAFLELASDVFWIQDIQTGNRTWFGQHEKFQKYNLSNGNDQDDEWLKKIHQDDRDRINQAFEKFLEDKSITSFQLEYWINGRDRSYFIRDKVKVERGDDGIPKRCLGVWNDITAVHEEKKHSRKLRQFRNKLASTIIKARPC